MFTNTLKKIVQSVSQVKPYQLAIPIFFIAAVVPVVYASEGGGEGGGEEVAAHGGFAVTFLWMAIILLAAKFASLVERFGQPAVLGELIIGVALGNLYLLGIDIFEPIKHNGTIRFLAELGVVILLFHIGLESNLSEMTRVGVRAGLVAIIGVVLPFASGYIIGPWLLPGLSNETYLFLGASLTATSVGITARVFHDLGKLQSAEAKIVLGAAVIDDVLGLIVLAVVSAIVESGSVSIGAVQWIIFKAAAFLIGTTIIGHFLAPYISQAFSRINPGVGMKFTLAISIGLIFAYLAEVIGLAPIVGAFAAGLVLEPVHFRYFKDSGLIVDLKDIVKNYDLSLRRPISSVIRTHSSHQIDELILPVSLFFVPIFFVVTGMDVRLDTLANPSIVLVALAITVIAFIGKYAAGLAAGSVNKAIVGWGMVPRGEVGLIFAAKGKLLGVVSDEAFSVIVIMVILTTLLTPPMLSYLLKKQEAERSTEESDMVKAHH